MLKGTLTLLLLIPLLASGQDELVEVRTDGSGHLVLPGAGVGTTNPEEPSFHFLADERLLKSDQFNWRGATATLPDGSLQLTVTDSAGTLLAIIRNTGDDTLTIENFVPAGFNKDRYFITGQGDHWLSRTRLFRPGQTSVPVILPDNAWELGYQSVENPSGTGGIALLSRRITWQNAQRRRFETFLYPGGEVTYRIWAVSYQGAWQEGLRKVFQEHYLFDLDYFDESLYEREDLKWIRKQ